MKTTTKIIFGAAFSVIGIATIGSQAWAAEITNLTSTGKIQMTNNNEANPRLSVDPMIPNVEINFTLNQKVQGGDYIEFSTHALPVFDNQDIFSDSTKTVKIGEMRRIGGINGSRSYQIIGNPISSAEFAKHDIIKQHQFNYRIVFNDNTQNLEDISFGISRKNGGANYSIANKEYSSRAWVKVANKEITSADFRVAGWGKHNAASRTWFDQARLVESSGDIALIVGYAVGENHQGGKVEYNLAGNPYYRVAVNDSTVRSGVSRSNFMYTDDSEVNGYGLIRSADIGKLSWEMGDHSADKVVFGITNHISSFFGAGFIIPIELTDEGKKYIAEKGEFPEISYTSRLIRADGSLIREQVNVKGKITIVGSSANFFSKIKEEAEGLKESVQPESERITTPQIEQIQAPNTGFSNGISALALSAVALLATVSAFFFKKK